MKLQCWNSCSTHLHCFFNNVDRNFNLNILFQSAHHKEANRLDQDEIVDVKEDDEFEDAAEEEKKLEDEDHETSQHKELVELWFELARHKAIVDWQTVSVAASVAVSQGDYANRDMSIANDGQQGVVLTQFPFSNKLLNIFNQPQGSIRRHVESVDEKIQIAAMEFDCTNFVDNRDSVWFETCSEPISARLCCDLRTWC